MINVVIIEDEELSVKRLTEMLNSISKDIQVVQKMDSIVESIEFFKTETAFDLVFLDIQLSDGKSFEIFKHVLIPKPIIFITAFDDHAIEAFKHYAIDYLLKPIKQDELKAALHKYEVYYKNLNPETNRISKETSVEKNWMLKIGQQIKVIPYSEASYYFTSAKITYLVNNEGKKYPIDHSLSYVEDEVDSGLFFRVNRQYLLSFDSIGLLQTHTKSRIKITLIPTNIEVIVPTEKVGSFKIWLQNKIVK